MGTKDSPSKFDCYSRAEPDEPMFVLLGRDVAGASIVRMWAATREAMGEDPEKIAEALACADAMEAWARKLGKDTSRVKFDTTELSDRAVAMIKGLVRYAELREADESKGVIWDDKSREALALAREGG